MNPIIQKSIILISYLIIIYVFLHTYFYLEQLNNCPCFIQNPKYKVDIEFMKLFQLLEIIIFTMYFLLIGVVVKIKRPNNIIIKILSSITLFIVLAINIYMSYNVINLYTNIKEDCNCSNGFYKYFLYYEGIVSISNILRIITLIITLFVVILFTKLG